MKQIVENITIVPTATIVPEELKEDTVESKENKDILNLGRSIINNVLALPAPSNQDEGTVRPGRKFCPCCGGLCRERVIQEFHFNEFLLIELTCSECDYQEEMYEPE